MHGLVNRALQSFVRDTYGGPFWSDVTAAAGLGAFEFEAMLHYEPEMTEAVMAALEVQLDKPRSAILEDLGTYLVAHPNMVSLRRLLRFGGVDFEEFLHSLDDLPDRVRLAVSDLHLPCLTVRKHSVDHYSLLSQTRPDVTAMPGFGHVMVGLIRSMADDYGALVFLEHKGCGAGVEVVEMTVAEHAFAAGRDFDLGVNSA